MYQDILVKRWQHWWKEAGAVGNGDQIFQEILAHYSEPHRAYHTLQHLNHCFEELDQGQHLVSDILTLELALWLHDIFYDPYAKDDENERRSAQFAFSVCQKAKLADHFATRTAHLISATAHMSNTLAEGDTQIMLDIDLAILGQSPEKFWEYEEQIRKEYSRANTQQYREGRLGVLAHFARRPILYLTPFFRKRYETQARKNLEASMRVFRLAR